MSIFRLLAVANARQLSEFFFLSSAFVVVTLHTDKLLPLKLSNRKPSGRYIHILA